MSEYMPTVGVFTAESKLSDRLINFLKDKDFDVRKNPAETFDIDYFVFDFFSGLSFSHYTDFISKIDKKCLLLFNRKDKKDTTKALEVNPNASVGLIESVPRKVFDYSESILKELMSFGHNGQTFRLKGKLVGNEKPVEIIKKVIPKTSTSKSKNRNHQKTQSTSILDPFKKVSSGSGPRLNFSNVKTSAMIPFKRMTQFIFMFLVVFLTPLFLILFSSSMLFLSYKYAFSKNDLSRGLLKVSETSIKVVKYVNFSFKPYVETAEVVSQSTEVVKSSLEVVSIASDLTSKITGDTPYDVQETSIRLSAELDSLYINLGFLKGLLDNIQSFPIRQFKLRYIDNRIEIEDVAKKIYSLKEVASNLDDLLGSNEPKKYLVLFQNNMELRPTGGFIGSFALMTFDKGRLTDITVSDVYSADGQLKGYVEPPQAIKEVLGEASWYLRDSNWDPDFPSTASKVEWFLEKEINEQVDGVVAIDLFLVQSLIEVTGPIALADHNKVITSENLYETTQSEVEDEFFPGSIKKASFLTALSRQLIILLEELPDENRLGALQKIYQSLEEKHIQLFVHQGNVQNTINGLGYDGSLDLTTECGIRCFDDKYALVEANLGVNKANYYIQRRYDLDVNVDRSDIFHELIVSYKNTANNLLGNAGKYKTYSRLVLPQSAQIGMLRLYKEGGYLEDIEYDTEDVSGRKEIGFLMEISPQEEIRLQVTWVVPHTSLSHGGEYRLTALKQAGTEADPLTVSVEGKDLILATAIPLASLTQQQGYVYNTDLRKDFFLKSFFKGD